MHNPTEHVQEHVTHEVAHGGHGEHGHGGHASWWITAAALTAALLAALAAITGFLATNHLTQSTLIRIKANDNWNFYQAKSIKSSILDAKVYTASLNKVEPRQKDLDKQVEYAKEMPELQTETRELEKLSNENLETHETYETAATMFHIAIAVVAIAVVAKRKEFWYMSMVGGVIGVYFFGTAWMHAPKRWTEEVEAPATQTQHGAPAGEHGAPAGGEHGAGAAEHGTPAAPTGEHAGPTGEHAAPVGEH
jgi:hypothetical protein